MTKPASSWLKNEQDGRITPTGIIVDQVSEVLDIAAEHIEPPPQFGGDTMIDFIRGMGKIGGNVKILLDIAKVLSSADVSGWAEMAEEMISE